MCIRDRLNNEVRSLQSINTSLEADLREVTTRMEAAQQHADDKIRQMINSEQRLSEQFENLANRIFEHSNRRVDEQNRQSLNSLLSPLREQLDGFRRQVPVSYTHLYCGAYEPRSRFLFCLSDRCQSFP